MAACLGKFDAVIAPGKRRQKLSLKQPLLTILLMGMAVRILMLWIGFKSFAPDAGLYFDYARNINEGLFSSNIANDGAVMLRTPTVDEIVHQSTGYIYALSYALLPTDSLNPVIILPVMGMLVVCGGYSITQSLFGRKAAQVAAALLAFHPTLVYFSGVGYGPEVFSLVFVLFSALLLLQYGTESVPLFLIGIFVALAESIWFVSFYLVVFLFPIALVIKRRDIETETILITLGLFATILARHLVTDFTAFILIWIGVFLSLAVLDRFCTDSNWKETAPYFLGIFLGLLFFYLPSQIMMLLSGAGMRSIALNSLAASTLHLPSLSYLVGGSLFLLWHITIVVFLLSLVGLYFFKTNSNYQMFLVIIIGALGGHAIALYSIEPMQIQYLYTTARFLQGIIVLFTILAGASLERVARRFPVIFVRNNPKRKHLGIATIVVLVVAGSFVPGYVMGVQHSKYVTPTIRFGWQGLEVWVRSSTTSRDIFLLERAREFAWMTDRETIQLRVGSNAKYEWEANIQMLNLAQGYSADYFLVDNYTIHRWDHFAFLLRAGMSNQTPVCLNATHAIQHFNHSSLLDVPSMRLVGQTDGNSYGDYVRIFEFITTEYEIAWQSDSLLESWESTGGQIQSDSENNSRFVLTDNDCGAFSLMEETIPPIYVTGGFLLLSLEMHKITVESIRIIDEYGETVSWGEPVQDGMFFCMLHSGVFEDIVVEVSGQSDGHALFNGVGIWQKSP